jgi:hypothetical protein
MLKYQHKEPALTILILGRPNDEVVWPVGDMFISTNHSIFGKIQS